MRFGLIGLLAFACTSDTRVKELERNIDRLGDDIEELSHVTQQMHKTLNRHRNAASQQASAANPDGFDESKPLPGGDRNNPDVIFLSIDTLRADHLGAWGYHRDTSPFLDSLAAEGTRFANAWSPSPWTLPSHTTMLTGLLPRTHGAVEDHLQIPTSTPMVQEAFRHAGYATGGVVSTLFVSKRFGFDRGFDFFQDFQIKGARANNAATVDAEHVFHHGLHWAQQLPEGKPVFLFLHVYDAHYGYNAPAPFNEAFDRPPKIGDAIYKDYHHYRKHPLSDDQMAHQIAQYDEEIAYVDHVFGELINKWRSERPNLIVVVTADHGEEFGERGSWGHAHTLFPEQLHVPLIVAGSGVRSQVVQERVGSEDLASTIANLVNIPFPSGDGVNRATQIRSGRPGPAKHVASRLAETSRFHTLRYRWHEPPYDLVVDLNKGHRFLCNLQTDPACVDNLTKQDASRAEEMGSALATYLSDGWEALEEGQVDVEGGVIYKGTQRIRKATLAVKPGDRFAVHPLDAFVSFTKGKKAKGPWRILGGEAPGPSDPLAYHGIRTDNASVDLADEEREMLEALGYIQD